MPPSNKVHLEHSSCTNKNTHCFFCTMEEPDPSFRKVGLAKFFREMRLRDDREHVLVLSSLWNIAMTLPDDPEFPSLGVFRCMADLIAKGVSDSNWLLRHQNIYIPYYAAHIIGSFTMNRASFAAKAVESGVIPSLIMLLRGKLSWVEQRVAVRALGHLASYDQTFDAVAACEDEVVKLAMQIASTCLECVYTKFLDVKNARKRRKYHRNLLTRGRGGWEMENQKAEQWASQLQCWSLYLLNCFAIKGRGLSLICQHEFLSYLGSMWGAVTTTTTNWSFSPPPAGIKLIRILCYDPFGRDRVAESKQVVEKLCNLSRSSDDSQYLGIDCLMLLLKDPDTRYKVIDVVVPCLVDLVELRSLRGRTNVGNTIARALLLDYKSLKAKSETIKALDDAWELKVGRKKRERMISKEKMIERAALAGAAKLEGNTKFSWGHVEKAILNYSEALEVCPLRMRAERAVAYSNRAQCHLMLKDADAAIRDATRALCLSTPTNSHGKSLWRRSQAYKMKGMGKESLIDRIMFAKYGSAADNAARHMRIPPNSAGMITKQTNVAWLFSAARSKMHKTKLDVDEEKAGRSGIDVHGCEKRV